jgi:hypothetical protein
MNEDGMQSNVGGQDGGFNLRQEYTVSEPGLDGWLKAREATIEARDEKGMKRATIMMDDESLTLPIDTIIAVYDHLISEEVGKLP